jgi:hypothetical protein
LGRRGKIFAGLFVLLSAIISSVAGLFMLSTPAAIQSTAKDDGEGASLHIYFYTNGGSPASGVTDVHKEWSASGKSDAQSQLGTLKIPANHEPEFAWEATRTVKSNKALLKEMIGSEEIVILWEYDNEVNGQTSGSSRTYEQKYKVVDGAFKFDFDKFGYVFTGWMEGDTSGPNPKSKLYAVDHEVGEYIESRSGNTTLHLWAKWEPIFFDITFAYFVDDSIPKPANNTPVNGVTWNSNSEDSQGTPVDKGITLSPLNPIPTGQKFLGWQTKAQWKEEIDTGYSTYFETSRWRVKYPPFWRGQPWADSS